MMVSLIWPATSLATQDSALKAQIKLGVTPQYPSKPGWLPVKLVFSYKQKKYTALLEVNAEAYNRHNQQTRALIAEPSYFHKAFQLVKEGKDEVEPLANAIRESSPNNSKEELASFALAFVQSLPYQDDSLTSIANDVWRWPLQTLVDVENDCEDSSLLYASLLSNLGISSALVLAPADTPTHMLMAVNGNFTGDYLTTNTEDTKYFLAETTGLGWQIGKMPNGYSTNNVFGLAIDPTNKDPDNFLGKRQTENSPHALASDTPLMSFLLFLLALCLLILGIWVSNEYDVFRRLWYGSYYVDKSTPQNDVGIHTPDKTDDPSYDWRKEYYDD